LNYNKNAPTIEAGLPRLAHAREEGWNGWIPSGLNLKHSVQAPAAVCGYRPQWACPSSSNEKTNDPCSNQKLPVPDKLFLLSTIHSLLDGAVTKS
jgi:hypothetical protein